MGDLQCAATLHVVRHGEAEAESDPGSDVGGSLTPHGREQSHALAAALKDRAIALVYASSSASAVQTAEIVAEALGAGVRVQDGLRESQPGESGAQVLDRMRAELESIADLHRGEGVLVVSHGGVICAALPQLVDNLPGADRRDRVLGHVDRVEMAVDGDGWVVRSWAGTQMGEG